MTDELVNIQEEDDSQKGMYLTFSLGNEGYGIEIRYVTEIIGMQPITEVPELPAYVRGIVNLRGKIIPVIDVRLRFKKEPVEYNDRTCIIVVDIKEISVGLIVDAVEEVLILSDENVVPPPKVSSRNYQQKYIKAIGKIGNNIKLLLDCDKMLNEEEVEGLKGSI